MALELGPLSALYIEAPASAGVASLPSRLVTDEPSRPIAETAVERNAIVHPCALVRANRPGTSPVAGEGRDASSATIAEYHAARA